MYSGTRLGFNVPLISIEESSSRFDVCINESHVSAVPLEVNIDVNSLSASPGEGIFISVYNFS